MSVKDMTNQRVGRITRRKAMGMQDLTGKRFGKLTVIEEAGRSPGWIVLWRCRCDCGKEVVVRAGNLRSGGTRSCGCSRKEFLGNYNTKHGGSHTRLYHVWCNMKQRCNSKTQKNYGGRGITVCQEWCDSFEAFRDWSMANGYRDDLTLDRIDNNGHYRPENCRWATRKAQNNNTRNNHIVRYGGQEKTISQWAEEYGIGANTLIMRLRRGWDVERALKTPVKNRVSKEK